MDVVKKTRKDLEKDPEGWMPEMKLRLQDIKQLRRAITEVAAAAL
jgi:hypothetical protein